MKRLIKSFSCALAGVGRTIATQTNMKIHLCFAALALILNVVLCLELFEWITIILLIGLVLAGECFNTALESMVDRYSIEQHPLSRNAKDAAAGAVLILALFAVIIGVIIYAHAFLRLIG